MRGVNPFEAEGEWLRCALHTHTLESDGELPAAALVSRYEAAGYHVVAITDHWRLTRVPSTARLLTIPAAELCFDLDEPGPVGEFLALGIGEIPDDPGGMRENWFVHEVEHYEQRTFPDLTTGGRWVEQQGGVAYVAHPYWSGLDVRVLLEAEGYVGLEVYNGSSELECGRGDSSVWWDALLGTGRSTYAIAVDDQHSPLFDLGLAWTWVRVADRTEEGVLHALRTGMAYGSNGPVIREVHRDGTAVEVDCSPCRALVLGMERERGCSVVAGDRGRRFGRILETSEEGLITRARIESPWPDPRYLRLTAVDARGGKAWTNPL
ncbi:MAG: PHP domain-containing protein [Actinobacteria bacterium]|nr:PHP domain-containing protein [Actinomycetota bacterium]